jgi:hypothetical protein
MRCLAIVHYVPSKNKDDLTLRVNDTSDLRREYSQQGVANVSENFLKLYTMVYYMRRERHSLTLKEDYLALKSRNFLCKLEN